MKRVVMILAVTIWSLIAQVSMAFDYSSVPTGPNDFYPHQHRLRKDTKYPGHAATEGGLMSA